MSSSGVERFTDQDLSDVPLSVRSQDKTNSNRNSNSLFSRFLSGRGSVKAPDSGRAKAEIILAPTSERPSVRRASDMAGGLNSAANLSAPVDDKQSKRISNLKPVKEDAPAATASSNSNNNNLNIKADQHKSKDLRGSEDERKPKKDEPVKKEDNKDSKDKDNKDKEKDTRVRKGSNQPIAAPTPPFKPATVRTKAQIEKDRTLGRMIYDPEVTKIDDTEEVTFIYSRRSYIDLKHAEPPTVMRAGQRREGLKEYSGTGLFVKDTRYRFIRATPDASRFQQVWDIVLSLPHHAWRSVTAGSLRSNVASPQERVALITKYKAISTVMMNLFAWRRSVLLLIFLLSSIEIGTGINSVIEDFQDHKFLVELANYNSSVFRLNLFNESELNYVSPAARASFDLPDPRDFDRNSNRGLEPFAEYTVRALQVALARMTLQSSIVFVVLQIIEVLLIIIASVLSLAGMFYWTSYDKSRLLVISGWFIAAFGPFMISLLPTQYFVEWDRADGVVNDYTKEFAASFGLANTTDFAETTRFVTEGFIGARFAVITFRLLAPAALSVAPALIRGAMKAKSVIPQTHLPGTFILLVPWLYAPLAWALYNVLLQMFARMLSPLAFFALLILALQPMAYYIVGVKYEVASAVADTDVEAKLNTIRKYSTGALVLGFILLFIYAFQIPDSQLAAAAKYILQAESLVHLFSVLLVQWLYTTVAGVDFMIWQLALERTHEFSLKSPEAAEELKAHRDFRLDEFMRFSGVEHESVD